MKDTKSQISFPNIFFLFVAGSEGNDERTRSDHMPKDERSVLHETRRESLRYVDIVTLFIICFGVIKYIVCHYTLHCKAI